MQLHPHLQIGEFEIMGFTGRASRILIIIQSPEKKIILPDSENECQQGFYFAAEL